MNATTFIVIALVLLAIGCVRQIRQINQNVASLFTKVRALESAGAPPTPTTETETRLLALEATERRRQQAEAEG